MPDSVGANMASAEGDLRPLVRPEKATQSAGTIDRTRMTELNARRIAETILDGFNRHYRIFLEITAAAKAAVRRL